VRELLIIKHEDGRLLLVPRGCTSQVDVIGLIEAARIWARCTFIRTTCARTVVEESKSVEESKPTEDTEAQDG
jgi:hypothetical protein